MTKDVSNRTKRRKVKTKNVRKKLILSILIPLCILFIGIVSYGAHLYIKTEKTIDKSHEDLERSNNKSSLRAEAVNPLDHNVSMLIMGIDTSDHRGYEEKSRTDSLLLATFNQDNKSIKLLSIPRDLYAYVPYIGDYTKINHAHFHGGPTAAVETVENLLDIPVDYYMRVDFEGFLEVIDTIGGIHFDVPYEFYESDSTDKKNSIHLLPGYQKVNGEEALALARTRKHDSDIERGKRQQEIIKKVFEEVTSIKSVTKVSKLIDVAGNNMTTNLSFSEIKDFTAYALDKDLDIDTLNFDGDGWIMDDGLWYFHTNENSKKEIEKELKEHLEIETD